MSTEEQFNMDSSDEEAEPEVNEDFQEQDSITMSKDSTWDVSSMIVFRERKGLESVTLSEDCQTIQITPDQWALKQVQSKENTPENITVITLTWDKLRRRDSHFYMCEIGFKDESNDSSSNVLLGLCEQKYSELRTLARSFFKEFRAKITRVKYYPLSFELAYFSSNGFDELGSRLGEIEDVLKTLCSRCVQSDLSLSVCLHQSEEQDNDEYEDDMEFTMSLCGSETDSEKSSLTLPGHVTNIHRTSSLGERDGEDSRLSQIKKELQSQQEHFNARFDEQQSNNEQQQQLLQSLAFNLKRLLEIQESRAGPGTEDIQKDVQNSSQLEDVTPATGMAKAVTLTKDTNRDGNVELKDGMSIGTSSKEFIPQRDTSTNRNSEESMQSHSYTVKSILQTDRYPGYDDKDKSQTDSCFIESRAEGGQDYSSDVKNPIKYHSTSIHGIPQQDLSQGKGAKHKEKVQLNVSSQKSSEQADLSVNNNSKHTDNNESLFPPLQIRSLRSSNTGKEAKPKEENPSGSSYNPQGYRYQDNRSNVKQNSQSCPTTLQLRQEENTYLGKGAKPKQRSQPHPSPLHQNDLPGLNLNSISNLKGNSQDMLYSQQLNPQPNDYAGEGTPSLELRPNLGSSSKVKETTQFNSSLLQLNQQADSNLGSESKATEKVQFNSTTEDQRLSDSQPMQLIPQSDQLEKDHSSDEVVESSAHSLNLISSANKSQSAAGSNKPKQNREYSSLPEAASATMIQNDPRDHHIVLQSSLSSRRDNRTNTKPLDNELIEQNTLEQVQSKANSPGQSQLVSSILQGRTGGKARHFLAKYGVRGTTPGVRRMIETVEAAMKDDANMPPRAKGLNTVLCVDTSDAMGEEGFERMKGTALDFIDGIEEITSKYEMEENVAVVAFGGKSRIVHHLSNDYSSVRIAVENLNFGGNASLFEALLVCLCTLHGRGDPVAIGGIRVHPRIMVLTTGCTVDDIEESVPDEDTLANNSKDRVVKLVGEFGTKSNETMFPQPVVWVPFNDDDRSFLEHLSEMEICELVECEDIIKLCRYQRNQEIIGKVYASIKDKMILDDETEVAVDDIINGVKEIAGNLEQSELDDIISDIEQRLEETLSRTQQSPQTLTSDFDNIVEFKDKSLPRLGDRVVRGPDWTGGEEDSEGPGTVINHTEGGEEEKKIVWILWDNGTCRKYRYGYHDAFDVEITRDQPRTTESEMVIHIGCEVTRGRDWSPKYNDQDGGAGGVGVVIRKNDHGRVKVRWSRSLHINDYRFGKDDKLDLRIRDPVECFLSNTEIHDEPTDDVTSQDGQPKDEPSETAGGWVWQWKADSGDWRLYEERINAKLEKEYQKRKDGSCVVQKNGSNFRVLFKTNTEKKVDGSNKTDVRRICMSNSDQAAMRKIVMKCL